MGMSLNPQGASEDELMLEINTTPLIDVMLVLLIMLIITIPVQLHAIPMAVPPASAAPPKAEPVIVQIKVDAANTVFWNGQALPDRAALEVRLQEAATLQPQPEIHIRADAQSRYATVAAVMASAQRLGLRRLGVASASLGKD